MGGGHHVRAPRHEPWLRAGRFCYFAPLSARRSRLGGKVCLVKSAMPPTSGARERYRVMLAT